MPYPISAIRFKNDVFKEFYCNDECNTDDSNEKLIKLLDRIISHGFINLQDQFIAYSIDGTRPEGYSTILWSNRHRKFLIQYLYFSDSLERVYILMSPFIR
jgi:hypothetical protein